MNEEATTAALQVLDDYMAALNRHDSEGMRAAFHFPHFRFAGTGVAVFEWPEDYGFETFDARTRSDGWHHSAWDYRKVVHAGVEKVHLDVQFTRYRADGSAIGHFQSFWIVVFRDGRWGVQARSSYAP